MVRNSARHLLDLINDVLDISKIEAGELQIRPKSFDLRESVDRVVNSVRPQAAAKSLSLDVIYSRSDDTIVSDQRRVEQTLLNLLNNAIKFTDRGGVTLRVDETTPGANAAVSERATVRLQVADSGIGIRPEDIEQLFKPFRQIDTGLSRRHEGTGLGLAICRRLVELLGGTISVESELGRGSVFTVTLPMKGSV
jgi:signal transduction histidine kinase